MSAAAVMSDRACQCCGVDPLAVACEAQVVRALEVLGKRIVRRQSSRWVELGGLPWHEVHTRWAPDARDLDSTLESAWDLIPDLCRRWEHPNPQRVVERLDWYTRRIVEFRQSPSPHDVARVIGL